MKECQKFNYELQAYYDGELTSERAARLRKHLEHCRYCSEKLAAYARISRNLNEVAKIELKREEALSLWPGIRVRLGERAVTEVPKFPWAHLRLWPRPVWISLAASVAVALLLIILAPLVIPQKLPAHYCQIENISTPDRNLMIYREKSDGFTIIWLTKQ